MFTSCYTDTEISQGYQQHMWDELCHIVVGVGVVFVSLHVVSVDEGLYPLLQICGLKKYRVNVLWPLKQNLMSNLALCGCKYMNKGETNHMKPTFLVVKYGEADIQHHRNVTSTFSILYYKVF